MLSQEIGAFEAKTHFSKILKEVKNGNDYIITMRGEPVAKIIPFTQEKQMTRKEAIEAMIEMRKLYRGNPGDDNIKDLINEGRRY